jgi:hypothetical protein
LTRPPRGRCLIALRLAERVGVEEEEHAAIYYAKIDASSRAVAGLFAVQHGLLPDDELSAVP